jgi:hypothetical protein
MEIDRMSDHSGEPGVRAGEGALITELFDMDNDLCVAA